MTTTATLRVGTRPSGLALTQSRAVMDRLRELLPGVEIAEVQVSSPGDRDRTTDLRESPPDFFTRDLDASLVNGEIDCAIHSAKDLPDPVPEALDWCWLPWRADPRDVLVLREGEQPADLPAGCRIGVSSDRREAYCRKRFPEAQQLPIRGNIEERLAQLDDGAFDVVMMAAAALQRLPLQHRITEWIPLADLQVPEGQGVLAITYRRGDARLDVLRQRFVKAVTFVGGGVGSADLCTVAGVKALARADVCLHDSLLDPNLLKALPPGGCALDVGKRYGGPNVRQDKITGMLLDCARKGLRVVRLKGGDPGIFGRLEEEAGALAAHGLPFRILPGVSSLNVATSPNGILLTRRGASRGYCVITPRLRGGDTGAVGAAARAELPIVFFMAVTLAKEVLAELVTEGLTPDTPATMVYNAGMEEERILAGTVSDLAGKLQSEPPRLPGGEDASYAPGLLIVGEVAQSRFPAAQGACGGRRVLLTCSAALQDEAGGIVRDFGGVPVPCPLIALRVAPEAVVALGGIDAYDWVVLTSPSSVRCFLEALRDAAIDLRRVPPLVVCGSGTARALREAQLFPALVPESGFSGKGLLAAARGRVKAGERVLRLRSDLAGPELAGALRELGAKVDDVVLYRNEPVTRDAMPCFDAVFFASSSAVTAFEAQWGIDALTGKTVAAIGRPTEERLLQSGVTPDVVGPEATVASCLTALAEAYVREQFEG